ncbi:predicted protein [Streptomyces viridosporus ATCC 14672]|uniref:Predicted protein n=1 Tax=Streptomyces viridosporus (strain ATCC 14672 / DSM 40746 / JCM 4963 / KCTC 9882 / NRRL B-12104 / FH 1290) TaxID=566461 RepID=D5ZYK6_STRV1|nr:predicted protein [Streptomyces viridosporus ATCC 14672]
MTARGRREAVRPDDGIRGAVFPRRGSGRTFLTLAHRRRDRGAAVSGRVRARA